MITLSDANPPPHGHPRCRSTHVRVRLIERFPDVCPDTDRITVQDIHNRFDGRVRSYVPILVEREAKIRLAELSERAET
jgi:hypothetical protein